MSDTTLTNARRRGGVRRQPGTREKERHTAVKRRGSPITSTSVAPIVAFLPIFEQPDFEFGQWHSLSHGVQFVRYPEEVGAFCDALHENGFLIHTGWEEFRLGAIAENSNTERIDNGSLQDLREMMSAIIRNETFHEGYLLAMLKLGVVTGILRRLKELDDNGEVPHS